jgi:hypothetical protein
MYGFVLERNTSMLYSKPKETRGVRHVGSLITQKEALILTVLAEEKHARIGTGGASSDTTRRKLETLCKKPLKEADVLMLLRGLGKGSFVERDSKHNPFWKITKFGEEVLKRGKVTK